MRISAIVFWVLSGLNLLATLSLTPAKFESGPVGGPMQTTSISLFDGMTLLGGLVFFSIFAFFIAGCVFWVGHLLSRKS